jgi:RNA polymerase primary sigma factor
MQRSEIIRKAVELGRQRGFVTFNQLNELLPSTATAPGDIEAVMEALRDEKLSVVDDD